MASVAIAVVRDENGVRNPLRRPCLAAGGGERLRSGVERSRQAERFGIKRAGLTSKKTAPLGADLLAFLVVRVV